MVDGGALPCQADFHSHGGNSPEWDAESSRWNSCTMTQPCPVVVYEAYKADDGETPTFVDSAAVTCVIGALTGDSPAEVHITSENYYLAGYADTDLTIRVLPGRVGWTRLFDSYDLSSSITLTLSDALKSKSYFEGCADLATDEAIYQCLTDWSDGCLNQAPVCPSD